jgi:hypothetical protein
VSGGAEIRTQDSGISDGWFSLHKPATSSLPHSGIRNQTGLALNWVSCFVTQGSASQNITLLPRGHLVTARAREAAVLPAVPRTSSINH